MGEGAIMKQEDITLTESFWRTAYPNADDAEIAERLELRRQQVAAHAALCAQEEAQDRANLADRAAGQPGEDDSDNDDSDEDLPAAEYTEWDDQGNVIARGWNAHPDRCTHCGAWDENDHMLSCPEHAHQDEQLSGIDALLAARTVIDTFTDEEEGTIEETLSPLTMRVMEPYLAQLASSHRVSTAHGSKCDSCDFKHIFALYYGIPDSREALYFEICPHCWNVHEHVTTRIAPPKPFEDDIPTPREIYEIKYESRLRERDAFHNSVQGRLLKILTDLAASMAGNLNVQTLEELHSRALTGLDEAKGQISQIVSETVKHLTEEQTAGERIAPVRRATSRKSKTASKPSHSNAAGELYAES